jgi:hypothetical protein
MTQPQAVQAVVVHEAPIARVLPNAKKWQRFFAGVYSMAFRFGSSLAALRFMLGVQLPVRKLINATKGINIHRKQSSERYISDKAASDFLVKQELLPVTNYLPDVDRIKQNGVKVFIAIGQWALDKKTWYAQADQILAEKLGCELVTFPGHHASFLDMPVEFAATLRGVLHKAVGVNQ